MVARSNMLDKQLKEGKSMAKTSHRILLLGAGGCGKSTVMKQMKMITGSRFEPKEVREYSTTVRHNLLSSLHLLSKYCYEFGYDLDSKENEAIATKYREMKVVDIDQLAKGFGGSELKERIRHADSLWKDSAIQKTFIRGNEFSLLENTEFFIETVGARVILPEDYKATVDHILRSRKATENITEYTFRAEGRENTQITLVDVGGQKDKRKKWIRIFDRCSLILFVASLNEYDMVLEEDPTKNRMNESLELFDGIRSMRWFENTPIVLFLNKKDLFEKKIKHSPPTFPDYKGGNDPKKAIEYFKNLFVGEVEDDDGEGGRRRGGDYG